MTLHYDDRYTMDEWLRTDASSMVTGVEGTRGKNVREVHMEAGERWMLNDVSGKPLYAWDSRVHRFRTAYDQLRRRTDSFLHEGAGAEMIVGRSIYGETRLNPEASNLRGKVVELRDQAGVRWMR